MEREVGGGIGMGTCKPMAVSFKCMTKSTTNKKKNVWQKPLQYCKVISLQLIKISEKKIEGKGNGHMLKAS